MVAAPVARHDRENPSGLDENGFPLPTATSKISQIKKPGMEPVYETISPKDRSSEDGPPKLLGYAYSGTVDVPKPASVLELEKKLGKSLGAYYDRTPGSHEGQGEDYGPPKGYTYDNGQGQNVLYDADGNYIGLQQKRTVAQDLIPLIAAFAGATFLGPALNSLASSAGFGGATSLGNTAALTAGQVGALPSLATAATPLAFTPEMIAAGAFTPGSIGAAGAVSGALTAEQLAAAYGVVTAGATPALVEMAAKGAQDYIDSGGAAQGGGGGGPNGTDIFREISKNQAIASGMGPGSMGADLASKGLLTASELAAAYGVVTDGSLLANLPKLPNVSDLLGKTSGTSGTSNTSNTYISGGTTGGSSSGPWNSYLTPQVAHIGAIHPTTMANPLAGLVSPIATNYTPSSSMLDRLNRNNFAKGGEVVKADLSKFEPEFVDIIKKRSGGSPDHSHPNYNGNPLFRTGGAGKHVQGPGTGQSDDIPAMLADGEYVFDADTVSALGDGSNKAGASALDQMRKAIRKHKRGAPIDKIPPKAKNPLEYLRGK
jgi:hypothetical protein